MFDMFGELFIQERGKPLQRPVLDYFRQFYADTATFTTSSIDCACDFLGADHVLYGTDAPFDAEGGMFSIRECTNAINKCNQSAADKSKMFYKNFEAIFKVPAAVPVAK